MQTSFVVPLKWLVMVKGNCLSLSPKKHSDYKLHGLWRHLVSETCKLTLIFNLWLLLFIKFNHYNISRICKLCWSPQMHAILV